MGLSPTQLRGACAESEALRYLQEQGLKLLERNFTTRFGELDLVMQHADCLVFVEVRLRQNTRFGDGAESVTHQKQQRLRRAAQIFLNRFAQRLPNPVCRFDVIAISAPKYQEPQAQHSRHGTGQNSSQKSDQHIHWIQDAFV